MSIPERKRFCAMLVVALITAVPGAIYARDRGINQPGAAGNRRGFRRY